MNYKTLAELFTIFLKIGFLAFGGGYAIIPLLQKEAVERKKWISNEELSDMMAIAQSLPGIIFVNSATMVGYRVCGIAGAVVATTASILPTFLLILLVTIYFWDFTNYPIVKKIFTGVLLGVTSLIIHSIVKMWKTSIRSSFDLIIVLLSTALLLVFKVNAVFVILLTAFAGFLYNLYLYRKEVKKSI